LHGKKTGSRKMPITITLKPVKLGKNNMVVMTMNHGNNEFKAYCTLGQYKHNEISSEVDMFHQLWGAAADKIGASFTEQFFDAAELIHETIGGVDRSEMLR
jgi:hypothetical protein